MPACQAGGGRFESGAWRLYRGGVVTRAVRFTCPSFQVGVQVGVM